MNTELRQQADAAGLPLIDYILFRIKELEASTGIKRTIFAACPNSRTVIKAALRAAKRNNSPIKFAATLNQVDSDSGYTGLTQKQFVQTIKNEAQLIDFDGPVIIAIDHGGPWLKDKHRNEKWSYSATLTAVKKSFEDAISAGYDLIHVDPTIDITIPNGMIIPIELVVDRTVDLISHTEKFRQINNYPKISYEVGTEEVHGGLSDFNTFKKFLELLKNQLNRAGLEKIWPCFVVGKVGTDLHTTMFDPRVAKILTDIASEYNCAIKGHYSDNVENPEEYPLSGMGAANVGPEFTECEYEGLMELMVLEKTLSVSNKSNIKEVLWNAVIESERWKKWLHNDESSIDFYKNDPSRQEWLIKTGCRYIWENPEVNSSRAILYKNLQANGINPEEIVLTHIEKAMDKYFNKFNLIDLNRLLTT